MVGAAILIVVPLVTLCILSIGILATSDELYEEPLQVRDRDLLTAEQQRQLVRNGEVDVWVGDKYVTLYNDQDNKVYLNEGGAR